MNFTLKELQTLAGLLDLATKTGGLAAAQQALPLVAKMEQMAKEIQDEAPTAMGNPITERSQSVSEAA